VTVSYFSNKKCIHVHYSWFNLQVDPLEMAMAVLHGQEPEEVEPQPGTSGLPPPPTPEPSDDDDDDEQPQVKLTCAKKRGRPFRLTDEEREARASAKKKRLEYPVSICLSNL